MGWYELDGGLTGLWFKGTSQVLPFDDNLENYENIRITETKKIDSGDVNSSKNNLGFSIAMIS